MAKFIDFKAIKEAVTVEQVLDHYGILANMRETNPDSLTGCCPFHNGQISTHFRVSRSKRCWNCFCECKIGGNVIDFVRHKEKVTPYEAGCLIIKWFKLSDDLVFKNNTKDSSAPTIEKKEEEETSVPVAAPIEESSEPNLPLQFSLKNLDPAHPYLTDRGLTAATVETFGLGYCSKGILTGRVAIPIQNGASELVAYAGRWPGEPPDDKPKYQLPKGFKKSAEVFNLHRAASAESDSPLIMVEGFFDCMKVWQAGFPRVVALMGSSLSPSQEGQIVSLLNKSDHIALMFDPDPAGLSIRQQALERFSTRAYVRVVELKDYGKQPDQLSEDQLRELIIQEEGDDYVVSPPKFPLGQLVATPNALANLTVLDIRIALARHAQGDWGELDDEDKAENELSLKEGFRLLSAYWGEDKVKFWIITEADRSTTTVLLPEDY